MRMRYFSTPFLKCLLTPALLLAFSWQGLLHAQIVNFTPLERGDYTEEEEKLFILRGVEVSGDYAVRMMKHRHRSLPRSKGNTLFKQDFRLELKTTFHRDAALHLELETLPAPITDTGLRAAGEDDPEHIGESQPLALNARQAYFRYRFNPRSAMLVGKHELSLGDRRGKVFSGILNGMTYDCRVGTWCMPFGGSKTGPKSSDWIYHWALDYTAWDEQSEGMRKTLEVEIFRIIYSESNVPLGVNRGPALYNQADPDNPDSVHVSQELDSQGNPIYFDAYDQNYFGFRVNWIGSLFFANLDGVFNQGNRHLRRYKPATGEPEPLYLDDQADYIFKHKISGMAFESEIGMQMPQLRFGFRRMQASGDSDSPASSGKSPIQNDSKGFHEITPGTYQGTRFYFNGVATDVSAGSGLGHSVNNTRMYGFFLDFSDPQNAGLDYSFGLYKLMLIKPIYNENGGLRDDVGWEMDNSFSFYLHKAIKLQFEVNLIRTQGAFRFTDYDDPEMDNRLLGQGISRLIYSF